MIQLRRRLPRTVRGHAPQQDHHRSRRLLVDYLVHRRFVLPQRDPVRIRHLADQPRRHAYPIVRKHRIRCHLLLKRDLHRAQRHRQIRGNVRRHPKPVRYVDHLVNAHPRRQLQRRNIARLRKRISNRHRALVVVLVVVRRVTPKAHRPIHNDVRGLHPVFDRRRVHIRFEA